VLRNQKCCQYFSESITKISDQKIESFQNFATTLTISAKGFNFKIMTKMEISECIVYVISKLIFLGGREITQEGGKILTKVSLKVRHNFGNIL